MCKFMSAEGQKPCELSSVVDFVNAMQKFDCNISIKLGASLYNAKSIIGALASGFNRRENFELVCTGSDEKLALGEALRLLKA